MTKAEREALEEIATGLGLAYYAVSHNRTDEALLHIGHHEAKLRAILATLDKPATTGTCPHGYPQTVRCSRCGE